MSDGYSAAPMDADEPEQPGDELSREDAIFAAALQARSARSRPLDPDSDPESISSFEALEGSGADTEAKR
eukprot:8943454-Lingulodinium_polyedra.AAC.1